MPTAKPIGSGQDFDGEPKTVGHPHVPIDIVAEYNGVVPAPDGHLVVFRVQ